MPENPKKRQQNAIVIEQCKPKKKAKQKKRENPKTKKSILPVGKKTKGFVAWITRLFPKFKRNKKSNTLGTTSARTPSSAPNSSSNATILQGVSFDVGRYIQFTEEQLTRILQVNGCLAKELQQLRLENKSLKAELEKTQAEKQDLEKENEKQKELMRQATRLLKELRKSEKASQDVSQSDLTRARRDSFPSVG